MCLLHTSSQQIKHLLRRAESVGLSHEAIMRLHWFAFALDHDCNVSLTCRHFGIARSTFLRWARRFDPKNPASLEEHSRSPHHVRTPQTDDRVVELIRLYRTEQPLMGKEGIAKLLKDEHGIAVSVSTVGRIIARHRFFFADTEAHQRKRTEELVRLEEQDTSHPEPQPQQSVPPEESGDSLPFPPDPVFGS